MGILIVDDSVEGQALLMRLLERAGYIDLVPAGTAEQAFQFLGLNGNAPLSREPDLILLDILMPGIDGVEVCRRIKATDRLRDIPIIMVTAKSETTDLQLAFSAGATDFITKPFNKIELLARVHSTLTLKAEVDKRKAREQDLWEINQALEKALQEVKVLQGLIPICASCKSIRNDQGSWQRLEEYLQEHVEAEFSHSICVTCMKKLYPGVYQN